MPERGFSEVPSTLAHEDFVARFGEIHEHSPLVAERVWDNRGPQLDTVDWLDAGMASCVDAAPHAQRLAPIRAHPDLAGRAAVAGELTGDSSAEAFPSWRPYATATARKFCRRS
ncbi:MAG: hypothetical protein OET44_06615 [Gammaproteobacteria bacterium]|nr:hypothetical protein [Gammaproteobacteria bacterium]